MDFWLGFFIGGFLGSINGILLICLIKGGKDEKGGKGGNFYH